MEFSLHPLTRDDTEAWAALLADAERVDDTGEHYDADDLAEELADPTRDQQRDFMGAWSGGALVGYASVMPRDTLEAGPEPAQRIYLEGATSPDHRGRGVGTALLAWATRRGAEAHDEQFPGTLAVLQCTAPRGNLDQSKLLADAGFVPQRWQFGMCRDLDHPVVASAVPDRLVLRPYDAVTADATREAHNDAFAEHWGFTPWSPTMWRQWVSDTRAFRPDVSRVLVEHSRPEVVVGYVVSYEYEADAAATGMREAYVGKVGVRRAWRRRGAASALLTEALGAYRAAGYVRATLDVDADNSTGALGVYQRLGFAVERRSVTHVLSIG